MGPEVVIKDLAVSYNLAVDDAETRLLAELRPYLPILFTGINLVPALIDSYRPTRCSLNLLLGMHPRLGLEFAISAVPLPYLAY